MTMHRIVTLAAALALIATACFYPAGPGHTCLPGDGLTNQSHEWVCTTDYPVVHPDPAPNTNRYPTVTP